MINNLYIDSLPARSRFGVWITRGGYADLLRFPSLREPETNDWPEEDGVEVDLSEPRLEEKEVCISFLATTNTGATDFVAYLADAGYHDFRIPSLGRSWRLRLESQPRNAVYPTATDFSLRFVEDVPLRPGSENAQRFSENVGSFGKNVGRFAQNVGRFSDDRYMLDNIPFGEYGVTIDISRSALLSAPTAKVNMNRKVLTADGQIYDAGCLFFQKKEATFQCHFRAATVEEFWQGYDAFFAALIQPGERQLYVREIGRSFPCYYKSSSSFRVLTLSGPVVVSFRLTLVFTVFRIYETDYFLTTEAGDWIVTEDGNYFIDMKQV